MKPKSSKRTKALAELMGIEFEFIEQCMTFGAVGSEEFLDEEAEFPPALLARLRRIQRICSSLDLDVFAGAIIVDLLERVEGLERYLERSNPLTSIRSTRPNLKK